MFLNNLIVTLRGYLYSNIFILKANRILFDCETLRKALQSNNLYKVIKNVITVFDLLRKKVNSQFNILLVLKIIIIGIQNLFKMCFQLRNALVIKIRCLGCISICQSLSHLLRISHKGDCPGNRGG